MSDIDPRVIAPLVARLDPSHFWFVPAGGKPAHVNSPLTDTLIARHLNGSGVRYGGCPIHIGTSTTRCAVLDLDSHKGEIPWVDMQTAGRLITIEAAKLGLYAVPFRSSGGSGIHLYFIWDDAQDAYTVRETLRRVLDECLLHSGTKGLAHGQVEIFPKQDHVPHDGFGSMFVLPMAGKSCALDVETFEDRDQSYVDWIVSEPLATLTRPPKAEPPAHRETPAELRVLKSALDAIPNSGTDELGRDDWRNILFAVHEATNGSEDGLALVHELSERHSNYADDVEPINSMWERAHLDRPSIITRRTLFHIAATRYGWIDPTLNDFDDITDRPIDTFAGKFKPQPSNELALLTPPTDIIDEVIPHEGVVVLYGDSGSGKTFMAYDMACAIARGIDWRSQTVSQGRVLYVCAENPGGFLTRIKAYEIHHKLTVPDVHVLRAAPDLLLSGDVRAIIETAKHYGPYILIVLDTLAQCIPGADENSAQDMGLAIRHANVMHEKTGATVMLVHHTGKDATKGARGSSSLRAAADAELEIFANEGMHALRVTKLKNGEAGAQFAFKLNQVPVGSKANGKALYGAVVEHTHAHVKRATRLDKKVGEVERSIYDAMTALMSLDNGARVSVNALADEVAKNMTGTRARERALRAINRLVERGGIREEGAYIYEAGD